MITSIYNWLKGKKTYGLGVLGLVYAGSAFATGHLAAPDALNAVWASLSLLGLRAGVENAIEKYVALSLTTVSAAQKSQ